MNQLSPASERRARFATLVFQERNKQEAERLRAPRNRLEWAGALAAFASSVWSSATPRIALIRLAALALACTEALDADPNQLTALEELQYCGEAAMTPEQSAVIQEKLRKIKGTDNV